MLIRYVCALLAIAVTHVMPAPVAAELQRLGDVTDYTCEIGTVTLNCGEALVRIDALTDHVLRVRVAPTGELPRDFSWAVENRAANAKLGEVYANDEVIVLATPVLRLVVNRRPCRLTVFDESGDAIVEEDPIRGVSWESQDEPSGRPFRFWQRFPDGANVFGLGEKPGGMHRKNRAWHMWNTDKGGYGPATDPIYAAVPFFIVARGDKYHGIFLDNTWRTSFDFGQAQRNLLSFGSDGGPLDYYIIAGPKPADVVRRYTELTGRIPLPPKWAIGYHQCRYSYFPESRVRKIANTFREKRIPCDVLYFDIDYMDGYRCFTWNNERFPDPQGLMNDLSGMGFHTIAIIDPGIKNESGYPVYDTGNAIDAWVKQPDGVPYVGRVWPGDCVFPDFTADRVRDWWADLFPKFIAESGLSGVWNDMNEPANFAGPNKTVPLDVRHDNAGEPASHLACHNVYGMQMIRATYDGLRRARPDERAFTLTRANYAGGQRFGAMWTGDNVSSWDHLAMSIPMIMGCGISGMPIVGPDIGGFIGGATPELYARWIQVGALFPYSRTHTSCNNPDQEPWSFGPRVEAIARTSLERRYRWMPYIYTLFEEASRTGLPIIRPIWMQQPGYDGWKLDSAFFLGPDIFVSPRLTPGEDSFAVELPQGVWFDGNTGEILGGGRWYPVDGSLETLPHFFRAGAIVPMQSVVQHTGEKPTEPLILDIWPWGKSHGTLYEDDGISQDYRKDGFRRTAFHCIVEDDSIIFKMFAMEGSFTADAPPPLVRMHHVIGDVTRVAFTTPEGTRASEALSDSVDNLKPGTFHFDEAKRVLTARMVQPVGSAQRMKVFLKRRAVDATAQVIEFDGESATLPRPRGCATPEYDERGGRFTVRWSNTARLSLPRLNAPLDALPKFTLRAATQHATRARLRFSTESDPERIIEGIELELTPDGELRDYSIDLADASGVKHGAVYWMEIEFAEGIRGGEAIRIERVQFAAGE